MMVAIYDNDTHCVTNQKLTLEMVKEISDSEHVLDVNWPIKKVEALTQIQIQ